MKLPVKQTTINYNCVGILVLMKCLTYIDKICLCFDTSVVDGQEVIGPMRQMRVEMGERT